jgi:hypothetical protein
MNGAGQPQETSAGMDDSRQPVDGGMTLEP